MADPASSLGLTQRRPPVTQQQAGPRRSSSSRSGLAADAPKTWVLWFLFGLGWPGLLLFGLSLLPVLSARVEFALLLAGWACVACWWAGLALGSLVPEGGSSSLGFRQRQAWRACVSMTVFGTALGCLMMTGYAWRNWRLLHMVPLAAAICIIVYSWLNPAREPQPDDEADSKGRGALEAEAVAAAPAAAGAQQ